MAFDRQAALQAGYTEEEIDSYLQNQTEAPPPPAATTAPGGEIEPPAPTTEVTPIEPSMTSAATTAAIGAAPYVLPVAGAAGAAIGGSKLYGAWNKSAEAAKALADAKMASEQGIAQRAAQKMGGATMPAAPAVPTQPSAGPGYGQTTYNAPMANKPAMPSAPAAPQAAPAAPQAAPAAESSMMNKASDVVRKLALDKVLKGAGIAAGAYELGKGLFYTSPEEIAILKQQEAKKRAQGWKPINER